MDLTMNLHLLDSVIERHYLLNRATQAPHEEAQKFAALLHSRLQSDPLFGRNCRVNIFGSMATDLWTVSSDVDIYVRLEKDDVDIPKTDVHKYFQQIKKSLFSLKCEHVRQIMCRVPVVKFLVQNDNGVLHGDISFLNETAIYNSNLLSIYSKWDDRFVKLGLFLKKWVSVCEVGSSEDDFLSSFSWILMLIQFLQNTSPPVLPNIQQDFLHEDDETRALQIVKGHNIYFHKQVKPNWSKNKQTVGELFMDFLEYYTKYDFSCQTIQIHQMESIAKPNASPAIVVLDPITHEKRVCYHKEKFRYITKIVIPKSREALSSPILASAIGGTVENLDNVLKELKIAYVTVSSKTEPLEIKFSKIWDNWKPEHRGTAQHPDGLNVDGTKSDGLSGEDNDATSPFGDFLGLHEKRIQHAQQMKAAKMIKKS